MGTYLCCEYVDGVVVSHDPFGGARELCGGVHERNIGRVHPRAFGTCFLFAAGKSTRSNNSSPSTKATELVKHCISTILVVVMGLGRRTPAHTAENDMSTSLRLKRNLGSVIGFSAFVEDNCASANSDWGPAYPMKIVIVVIPLLTSSSMCMITSMPSIGLLRSCKKRSQAG